MALTFATGIKAARASAVLAKISSGTGPGILKWMTTANATLVTFNLPEPEGVVSATGITWDFSPAVTAAAGNTGTAGKYRLTNSAGAFAIEGTITASGGGGDLEITNTSVASGQSCSMTSLVYTEGN